MLTPEGTAKLGDFGMAKPFSDESISGTGAIEGTIPYMSPEQAKGLPPDSPSDMYSFGVTLYEMVTGRRPFHGEDVSVLLHHLNSIPPPPTRFMLACPPRLETLILNLLEKDPELRPSASSAEEELRSIRAEFLGERSEPIVPISAIPGANDEDDGEIEIPSLESLQVGRLSDALSIPFDSRPAVRRRPGVNVSNPAVAWIFGDCINHRDSRSRKYRRRFLRLALFRPIRSGLRHTNAGVV